MAILKNPVIEHDTRLAKIRVYPKVPQLADDPVAFQSVLDTAVSLGAHPDQICVLKPASTQVDRGFKEVVSAKLGVRHAADRLEADGAVISRPGDALILPTGDCAVSWIENLRTKAGALGHCGRSAIRPKTDNEGLPVPVSLLQALESNHKREHLHAFVTNSICPKCFKHETPDGQKLIHPFVNIYGSEAFSGPLTEGRLKSISIIRFLLRGHGVPENNILTSLDCPSCNPARSSNRRGDTVHRDISIAVIQ